MAARCARHGLLDLQDIYDEHVWRVYAFFAYRLGDRQDAEDLTQATFERALKARSRYDARRGSPLTWLLAIAQNLLVDHYRRRHTSATVPLDTEQLEHSGSGVAPADELSLGLEPDLAAALALLGDREREIVALRYGADLTGPEIAELKGLTLANVQQILSRSLRRLRAEIEERRASASGR
jgi:RNA polymerase sigma-70 factor (ECF subfamily)